MSLLRSQICWTAVPSNRTFHGQQHGERLAVNSVVLIVLTKGDRMPIENAPFSQAEYDRRIALTRKAMESAGIDVLFVTDPSNQAWLTGYDGWSFYVHQGVILGKEGPFHVKEN
jgi:hypothetical protein